MLDVLMQNGFSSVILGFCAIICLWILYTNRERSIPPGPIALPVVGNLRVFMTNNGDILSTFRQLRSKYGDLFSLKIGTHDAVVVSGYETLRDLFVKKGDEVSDRPNSFMFAEICKGYGVAGSSGKLWKNQRAFAVTMLRNFGLNKQRMEEHIIEEVSRFLQEIESKQSKPFSLDGIIDTSVSNVICSVVFGKRFDYKDKRFLKLLQMLANIMHMSGHCAVLSILPILWYIPGDLFKGQAFRKQVSEVKKYLDELIQEHSETYEEDNLRDFIDAFLKEKKQNKETFTDRQLNAVVFEMFIAGTETTATTLKWAVLYLINHDDVQRRMRQELDDVIGATRQPSLSDRSNLPYCNAVITEILRCQAATPLSLEHTCDRDITFRGYTIKKGTFIIPNLDSVHKDSTIFTNPGLFNPERFLDENGVFHDCEKVVSFSIGPRMCLGAQLARSELFLFITSLVQQFNIMVKDERSPPQIKGTLGLSYKPWYFELRAEKRN